MKLISGDGRKGYPAGGPYHAIHVGAAAHVLPEDLVAQLVPGKQ
jgi:protein-L-isoaspartate(D-aspartate) O-methyltransferase